MREYDQIADWYVDSRRPEVGVPDLMKLAELCPHQAKVLDAGCGHGVPVSRYLLQQGFRLSGLDSSVEMIARYRTNFPGVPTRRALVQDTHFEAESFDAVVAWGLLFHLSEGEQEIAIRKASDWLRRRGWFLFTSGAVAGERTGEMGGVEFRYRSLGVDTYRKVLEEAGLCLHDHRVDEWENHVYFAQKSRGSGLGLIALRSRQKEPPCRVFLFMGGLVSELEVSERPRERLLAQGPGALADSELLAVLLRTGARGSSVLETARELLKERSGLAGLVGIEPAGLRKPGIGPAKIAAVLAAVELGRRLARRDLPERDLLGRPEAVARYLRLRYARQGQEILGALYLDAKSRLIAETEVFRGTLMRAAVSPRELLKKALLVDAARLIVFHTHPSGDPSPSAEDLAFTRRLADAGAVVGVELLDHLVLGGGDRWVSLRMRGGW